MTGGAPEFTREYVVRGDRPRGPLNPGALLFSMTGDGTGEVASCERTGSGNADPSDSDSLCIAISHLCRLSPQLSDHAQLTS